MPWGLCVTEHHGEARAARELSRIGVRTILAKYYNHRHRHKCLLFPRYLFVDLVDHWRQITRTDYVQRLFTSGDNPCIVPNRFMAELQAKMKPDGTITMEPRERFTIGTRVEIIRGQFKSLLATYDGLSLRKQETALIEILGRKVRVEFQPGDLAPV
jgi:transcription antitermination factor NusG